MKRFLSLIALLAFVSWSLPSFLQASNRADINCDHTVNATDLVLLSNIMAGNIDAGNYNLSNVVVVAPQGGDFTDPCTAAEWVATQSPSIYKLFVILVTPGNYYLDRTLVLPDHTLLKGYGISRSFLNFDSSGTDYPYGAVVSVTGASNASIEGLCISNNMGTDVAGRKQAGIFIRNSDVEIRNCQIVVDGQSGNSMGICAVTDTGASQPVQLDLSDSKVTASAGLHSSGEGIGLYLQRTNTVNVSGSVIRGQCFNSTSWGTAICENAGDMPSTVWVKHSHLDSYSTAANHACYFWRYTGGPDHFYYCQLNGTCNVSDKITRLFCHDGAAAIP